MKKALIALIAIGVSLGAGYLFGISSQKDDPAKARPETQTTAEETTTEQTTEPAPEEENLEDYYGCPNSDRIKALRLKSRKILPKG